MAKRRPSGDGMVRKRDDGRWEGRIVVGHKENGDSIFRYVYAPTQKELSAKLRQHIDSYQGADLTEQSRMTLSEWLNQWLENMADTLRPNTLRNYRSYIENQIRPALGDKQLARITPKDVQRFYEKLSDCLASSTVRRIHTTLHGTLKAAQQAHLIASNPTEQITAPRFSYGAKQILTDEQLDVFMKVIAEDEIWCDFFYTELTTGLRRGEICGLKWEDFDETAGTLKVCRTVYREAGGGLTAGDTKTSAGTRKIVLPSSTAALLSKRKASALTEWIFPNPLKPEQPVNPGSAYRRLKILLKRAGLPNIRFHDLRHTFATHALASGVDVKTLSGILGHTIGKVEIPTENPQAVASRTMTDFKPKRGKRRYWGSGYLGQTKGGRWNGRYTVTWPDGTKRTRDIYADTAEECEKLLAVMITEMKSEVAAEKERLRAENRAS